MAAEGALNPTFSQQNATSDTTSFGLGGGALGGEQTVVAHRDVERASMLLFLNVRPRYAVADGSDLQL